MDYTCPRNRPKINAAQSNECPTTSFTSCFSLSNSPAEVVPWSCYEPQNTRFFLMQASEDHLYLGPNMGVTNYSVLQSKSLPQLLFEKWKKKWNSPIMSHLALTQNWEHGCQYLCTGLSQMLLPIKWFIGAHRFLAWLPATLLDPRFLYGEYLFSGKLPAAAEETSSVKNLNERILSRITFVWRFHPSCATAVPFFFHITMFMFPTCLITKPDSKRNALSLCK